MQSKLQLQFIDLDAAGDAALGEHVAIDGQLVGSRLIGNVLFLVSTHSPRLAYELLSPTATTVEKESTLAKMTSADVLPTWRADGAAAQQLVADTDCYLQPANSSFGIQVTTITAIDMATLARSSRCFLGGTETLYMAPTSLYVATTRYPSILLPSGLRQFSPQFMTDIHKFAVDGLAISYRASGSVRGSLGWDAQRAPYRMSELNADLRVLTFNAPTGWGTADDANSATPPSPATLTVLRESTADRTLATLATLPNDQHPEPLGKAGEQVHAVRFVGTRGYLVTFRTIDPLYVLDLSNPADPRTAGSLDVTGFSDYLFPLSDALLFGVGRSVDANGRAGGIQLGVFHVADPSQPKALATTNLGTAGSQTALDASSHGLNWLQIPGMARIGLPVVVRADPFDPSPQHGLQRIEVDTMSGSMALKALLAAPGGPTQYPDVTTDRSLQLGAKLVYLTEGQLVVADW
ncbi:MAG: beta-propeller domain-containing protein [Rhizobacter sp.]|nr:beta-propeller domain-containing protein [Rhizobacter sp.]